MFGTIESLRELFELELRYALDCENKLVEKGLPAMIEKAHSAELQTALRQHLQETLNHVGRLQRVCSIAGIQPDTKGNAILKEMMDAATDSAAHIEDSPLRDLALTVNGNFVEHYEIALYGSLVEFAGALGFSEAVRLLEETLNEEKAADAKLTQIGKTLVSRATRQAAASV
jgi:ferritin-like metal-binding protein YciE